MDMDKHQRKIGKVYENKKNKQERHLYDDLFNYIGYMCLRQQGKNRADTGYGKRTATGRSEERRVGKECG